MCIGRYYVMPLVYLLKDSAKMRRNILTGKHEMTFDILMWSVEAREAVYRHLKDDTRPGRFSFKCLCSEYLILHEFLVDLQIEDIEMLPMEKVRITWRDDRFDQQQFKLQDHWKSNTHLPSAITFQFTCR